MKRRALLVMLLMLLPAAGASAQTSDLLLTSEQRPVRLSFGATYQRYVDGDLSITQWSMPLLAAASVGRHLRVRLLTSLAVGGGTGLERVSGLNNARLTLSYARRVGAGSLVLNLGASLPTGKRELTAEAFRTVRVLSRDIYSFRVPGLGQGLGLSPGVTGAFPLGERVVVGGGIAYQFRGGYTPVRSMDGRYEPGDEVLLTGGLNVRLARASAVSGDLTYTFYGEDTIGDELIYGAGSKLTATLQLLHTPGLDELRLVAHYRSRAKSELPLIAGAGNEIRRTLPNMLLVIGSYRMALSRTVSLTGQASGRFFDETDIVSRQTVADVGGALTFGITDEVNVVPRFLYTFGSFSGIEAGLGLDLRL